MITWLGRVYDVSPEQHNLGLSEGMELWTTGQGFAPLDIAGVESWLFDAPREAISLLRNGKSLTSVIYRQELVGH